MSNPTPGDVDPERVEQAKPRAGCWFLIIPIVAVAVVFALYAYMLYYGFMGRPADGGLATLHFDACPGAAAIMEDRLELMGLPEVSIDVEEPNQVSITARMPGDADTAAALPSTLAATGLLEIRTETGEVMATNDDLTDAGFRLDMSGTPNTFIAVKRPVMRTIINHQTTHVDGSIDVVLDGEVIHHRTNIPAIEEPELDILPMEVETDKERMLVAVNRGVVLAHGPHPCAVTHTSTETAE